MTPQQIINAARTRYNSEGDTFFSDAMLLDSIFEAETILVNEFAPIEATFSTVSVSGTRDYEFPTTTISIKRVLYNSKPVEKMELYNDPKTTTSTPSGEPYGYTVWDNIIVFYPTPSVSGDTITLYTYELPTLLAATTDPMNVPVKYHPHIIDYVLYHMCLKDNNTGLASVYLASWSRNLDRLKRSHAKEKRTDTFTRVRETYFGTDVLSSTEWWVR
jgi:hypothetical protein